MTKKLKKWRPKDGERYWVIYSDGDIAYDDYPNGDFGKLVIKFGNAFKTRKEALEARKRVKAALKGTK
jgi:hypothetical protein